MAGAATDLGLSRSAAQNGRRIEGEIAEIDEIGFVPANGFGVEQFTRPLQRFLIKLGAGGQHRLVAAERKRPGLLQHQELNQDQDRTERRFARHHRAIPVARRNIHSFHCCHALP
jgi:hypothetical protein